MRTRHFARELALVAVLGGAISVGCGLFGDEEASDDDGATGGSGGTAGSGAGVAGSGFSGTAGTGPSGGASGAGGTPPTGGSAGSGTSGSAGSGIGGSGGAGGMPPVGDISWDMTGYIDKSTNAIGVNGSWYNYNDCADAMPQMVPCTMPDMALLGPNSQPGWATTPAAVCMKGTAAQVMMTPDGGTIDYFGIQWGAGIAFDLNHAGGTATAMPFDATAAGITGFIFDVTGTAPMRVRINYVMPTTESTSHFLEVEPGTNIEVGFTAVNQGSWVMAPVAFDPTQLRTIQFQVFTNDMAPTPYDFCVSNIRVMRPM